MSNAIRTEYRDRIVGILDTIIAGQGEALDQARDAIAKTISEGGLIHVAGSGHSHMLAEEVFYRAGGIAAAQAMLDEDLMLHRGATRSTELERETGRAATVIEKYGVARGDIVIIASNSGRNAYPIEMATLARERGATTIAITSLRHAQQVTSRHESGKRLFEVADIVLDNGGEYGDSVLTIPGLAHKMGPTSTIAGVFLLNTIIAEATADLVARGFAVDVYESANTQADPTQPSNMVERWRGRIRNL